MLGKSIAMLDVCLYGAVGVYTCKHNDNTQIMLCRSMFNCVRLPNYFLDQNDHCKQLENRTY